MYLNVLGHYVVLGTMQNKNVLYTYTTFIHTHVYYYNNDNN